MSYPEGTKRTERLDHIVSIPPLQGSASNQPFLGSRRCNELTSLDSNAPHNVVHSRKHHHSLGDRSGALHPLPPAEPQRTQLSARYQLDDLLGNSDAMEHCRKMANIAAGSPSTVLIHGESGTGKELLAQGIHNASDRCQQPFVAINCAALSETLLESELFGYVNGAFTGAKKGGQVGKVEVANGGTLFLDEIGDMPLAMQVKMLRMLQERSISRVGCNEVIDVDLRIIAATHKDLSKEIKAGNFRRDLYYRLNVLPITIAPLRERLDDLKPLVFHLVDKFNQRLNKQVCLEPSFVAACRNHHWPGNVRELENIIERAINLTANGDSLNKDALIVDLIELTTDTEQIGGVLPLKQIELEMITRALTTARGNILHASGLLGISRNTIYRKIKEHDIVL